MAAVILDRIDDLSMEEINGAVRKLTRKARVVGLTGGVDYSILMTTLQQAGIPAIGSSLAGVGFEQLVLVARRPRMTENDPGCYDVLLDYEHILDGANQNLGSQFPFGTIFGKMKCSVQQKKTNFYLDYTKNPPVKTQITVSYRYPVTGNRYGNHPNYFDIQGGEVDVYVPHRNLNFSGYKATAAPWVLANSLLAAVNSTLWCNFGPTEWMCTEVTYEMMKRPAGGVPLYQFGFEFQHNPDGWPPTAVYIDPDTGTPPTGLTVANNGIFIVPYYRKLNFNLTFNAFFEGWAQVLAPLMGF